MTVFSVKDMMTITGVSKRTLHYYDEVNLLNPSKNKINQYREYSLDDLIKLQRILFYKKVGLNLHEIKELLVRDDHVKREFLSSYNERLKDNIDTLSFIQEQLESFLGGTDMSDLDIYNKEVEKQYEEEAKARWGDTDSYQEFKRRQQAMSEEEKAAFSKNINDELMKVFHKFSELTDADVESSEVREIVFEWKRAMLTVTDYSDEVLIMIADGYQSDERFTKWFDQFGNEDLVEFIVKAVRTHLG